MKILIGIGIVTLVYHLILFVACILCRLFYPHNSGWMCEEYDRWTGIFIDRKRQLVYILFLPCTGIWLIFNTGEEKGIKTKR